MVSIVYSNISPDAEKNVSYSATDKESFVDMTQLSKGLSFTNYGNPCEGYSVSLDGTMVPFPKDHGNENLGFWSESLSDEDGNINITLEITSDILISSPGITFTFDQATGVYASKFKIQWYNEDTLLAENAYSADSTQYFAIKEVNGYNKVVVTFNRLNAPLKRLVLHSVVFGNTLVFDGESLRNVRLTQEIDPISTKLTINMASINIYDKDKQYSFQQKQPMYIYFNDELYATMFVQDAARSSKSGWSVTCEDYISLLDKAVFVGGIYRNKKAGTLLEEIFGAANVPYTVDESISNKMIWGYLPYTTCREALKQVAFACCATVSTAKSDVVKVFSLNDTVTQNIPMSRIKQGQTITFSDEVTGVTLVSHNYSQSREAEEIYNADESGTGNDIFLKFSDPMAALTITNGTFIETGVNFARFNAEEGCIVTGKPYYDTKTAKSIRKVANTENIVEINDATLVTSVNVGEVLEHCYNYLKKSRTINAGIYEGYDEFETGAVYGSATYGEEMYGEYKGFVRKEQKRTSLGDYITMDTEYSGTVGGNIIRQSYGLNGGIIMKDSTVV